MVREFSAGGVVVRWSEGQWWLAVIEPQSSSESRRSASRLALPKGLVDPGEKPQQTAVREVREETGVVAEPIVKLSDVRYVYLRTWSDGQRVFKVVSFYLLLYRTGELGDISPEMRVEVRSAQWIPLEDAPRRLTHRGEKDVAELALNYLRTHPQLTASAPQA
jgi:8-oxo-dGTP pyrophosphatase MutT (NUDIX family)